MLHPDRPIGRIVAEPDAIEDHGLAIFCPHFAGLDPALADLTAVLPTMGINERLIRSLPASAAPVVGERFAGILAVDPFVTGRALFRALRRRGLGGVVNLPTVAFAEGEFRRALEAGGLDHAREIEMLAAAREEGLDAMAVVFSVNQALRAQDAGIGRVVLHPGLIGGDEDDRRHLGQGVAAVVRRLGAIAPRLRVLVYRHPALDRMLDQAVDLAHGEVRWAVR